MRRIPFAAFGPNRRPAWPRLLMLGILALSLAAGCSEEIDQRAVQPGIVRQQPTPFAPRTASPEGRSVTDGTGAPLTFSATPTVLEDRRRVYFTNRGDLWQLPVDNAAAPVIKGQDILAYAPSPDGEQIAVVFQSTEAPAGKFAIVNADSTIALEIDPAARQGTPTVVAGEVHSIDWSPQGTAIAVARQDGSITVIGMDGSVRVVVPPEPNQTPGKLVWSPDGQALAYLNPSFRGQFSDLYVVSIAGDGGPRLAADSQGQQTIVAATWLPGSSRLAYILSPSVGSREAGSVFTLDVATGRQELLVSSGEFAPVAGINAIAASPNGNYLAMTVLVPGERGWRFQSLWLLDLESGRRTEIPAARDEAVTDLWWASGYLIYRGINQARVQITGLYTGIEPFALYQVTPSQPRPQERFRTP